MQPNNKQSKQQAPKQRGYIRKVHKRRVQYPDQRQFKRSPEPDPVAPGEPVAPIKPGKWRRAIREFVAHREKEREKGRERDECGRDRRKMRMPRPYLDCSNHF